MKILLSTSTVSELPLTVADAFFKKASAQRGAPEQYMIQIQKWCPGVLGYVVEHVGDLSHRLTSGALYGHFGYDDVLNKVNKSLKTLTSAHGFEKELDKNIRNNAQYRNTPESEYREKLRILLEKYAKSHQQLPAYNYVQHMAKEAALNLGHQRFDQTVNCLLALKKVCVSPAIFDAEASKYVFDGQELRRW